MSQLENEIDANHVSFFKGWTAEAAQNWKVLEKLEAYKASYRRLSALQALKVHLITPRYTPASAAFFHEAHNDALVSHVSASGGAWRSALQSLRGCIENILCAVYYNDHPVELELWASGKFRIGFTELIKYMESHPRLSSLSEQVRGTSTIRSEYATLSKAVHGSAANFRMTDAASTVLLWSSNNVKVSMWAAREKKTIEGLTSLLICLHAPLLQGTNLAPLRDMLHLSISANIRKQIKKSLKINIPDA